MGAEPGAGGVAGESTLRAWARYGNALLAAGVVAAVAAAALLGALRPVETLTLTLARELAGSGKGDEPAAVAVTIGAAGQGEEWPRDRLARLHDRIRDSEPAAVGYALALETPQYAHPRAVLADMLDDGEQAFPAPAKQRVQAAIDALATDAALAQRLEADDTAVWGMRASLSKQPLPRAEHADEPALDGLAIAGKAPARGGPGRWLAPQARRFLEGVHAPVNEIAEAAIPAGLVGEPSGGTALALAHRQGEAWLPTLALLVHARAAGVEAGEIRVAGPNRVSLADASLPTGPALTVHAAGADYERVEAQRVLSGAIDPALFAGRAVVVGLAAADAQRAAAALGASSAKPVGPVAADVAALVSESQVHVPGWALIARGVAFVVVLAYLAWLVPALRGATGWILTAAIAVVAINAELVMLATRGAWLPLVAPTGALLAGHVAVGLRRAVGQRMRRLRAALDESNRTLAEAHREAGRLDEALQCLRQCSAEEATVARMYRLGLDLERRRRFPQAAEAFRYCARHGGGYEDAAERASRCEKLQKSVSLGGGHARSTQTLALDEEGVEKPVLGRYEVERELGKGAMGTVFLGRDPRIGRQVAIKTMPLDQEFEGQSLDEVKQRFLREAETAGRLSHPNIVTVHDVGEEQDLAYIAMDYLRGTPMNRFAEPDQLLPVGEVFAALAQVADALAVAHGENVVHRDVKPDNIVYDRDSGHVTVTDFGVACLLDERQTRTGTILGSPSYMSPEQLAGRGMDGRSDLFSLGVTLYQLLSGELPFTGDSLSSLMYRISHERHRELRRLRPDLPTCATTITNRCLEKEPDRRYASAAQLAQALRRCREKLDQEAQGSRSSSRKR